MKFASRRGGAGEVDVDNKKYVQTGCINSATEEQQLCDEGGWVP